MKYAPVLIITLNRYEHLKRCIDSLRKNALAENTDLYIALDYPPNKMYEKGYHRVNSYLNSEISGFHSVTIIKRTTNLGVFQNFYELQKIAYKIHDRFIYSEDDNEFSPNYLEYMNRCLDKYEHDDTILAISGYNYPIEKSQFKGNVYKSDAYFSAFGYGMWKRKEDKMRAHLNMCFFNQLYKSGKYMKELSRTSKNQYVNMIKGFLEYTPDLISHNKIREVDLAFGLYMVAYKKKMIFPVTSKVRNWGYDGSGVNCEAVCFQENNTENHRNFQFDAQTLDTSNTFLNIIEEIDITPSEINELLDKYFFIPKIEYLKTKIAYIFSRVISIQYTRKLISLQIK